MVFDFLKRARPGGGKEGLGHRAGGGLGRFGPGGVEPARSGVAGENRVSGQSDGVSRGQADLGSGLGDALGVAG